MGGKAGWALVGQMGSAWLTGLLGVLLALPWVPSASLDLQRDALTTMEQLTVSRTVLVLLASAVPEQSLRVRSS
jgi:hypothetical protein